MNLKSAVCAIGLFCSATLQAGAGITVSSFRAGAGTNAFAPLDKSMYFDEQYAENVSPAIATASGD